MSTYSEVTNDQHDPNYPTLGSTSRQELNTGTIVSNLREAVSFFHCVSDRMQFGKTLAIKALY